MESLHKIFTKEYLTKIESLSLNIKPKYSTGFSGARKSNTKGNSMEFTDFRDYTQKDDIRRIDWNSYSRLDRLYIKLFNEEKQAVINIFLDKSHSMDFGEINKLFFAKIFAATLSYLAIKNADKINIYCWDEKISFSRTNLGSKNLFPSVLSFLDSISLKESAKEGSNLTKALDEGKNVTLGPGVSFILSDFLFENSYENPIKFLQSKKQDVYIIHILDKTEINPELSGNVRLVDVETDNFEDIFITSELLNNYKKIFLNYQNSIKGFCQNRGVGYLFSPTDSNIIKLISG